MPYLSALEVCSRWGAIQIHVNFYLTLPQLCEMTVKSVVAGVWGLLGSDCCTAGIEEGNTDTGLLRNVLEMLSLLLDIGNIVWVFIRLPCIPAWYKERKNPVHDVSERWCWLLGSRWVSYRVSSRLPLLPMSSSPKIITDHRSSLTIDHDCRYFLHHRSSLTIDHHCQYLPHSRSSLSIDHHSRYFFHHRSSLSIDHHCWYLPHHRSSLSLRHYQVILLGDSGETEAHRFE